LQWFATDPTNDKNNVDKYMHKTGAKTVKTTTNSPTTLIETVTNSDGSPVDPSARAAEASACGPMHFMCDVHAESFEEGDGRLMCLPLKWRCDNVDDCPDGSVVFLFPFY
jgi:hypothetical protein